ncbi:MAG: hypothetical protein FJ137_22500 [Deltaproteobacteria bacterium]|nr:hypothetical protein [Deltaproteobacteria bacterium]
MLRVLLLVLAGAVSSAPACSCDPPPPDRPARDAVGDLRVVVDGATAELSLSGLLAPLRALQVDIAVEGGRASAVTAVGPWNVVEAGLQASAENPGGGPKDRFTLVLADTRRLPVADGAVARLVIDANATVSLTQAFAVDAEGKKRPLTVVTR